jgi:hypothetical protein
MTGERAIPAGEILVGDAVEIMNCLKEGTADMIFAERRLGQVQGLRGLR